MSEGYRNLRHYSGLLPPKGHGTQISSISVALKCQGDAVRKKKKKTKRLIRGNIVEKKKIKTHGFLGKKLGPFAFFLKLSKALDLIKWTLDTHLLMDGV